jgi:uncharacterized protein
MDPQLIIDNLLQPSILFFMLGMGAVLVRSDLEIPPTLSKLFSLYLLLSIGFKGGVKLAESGIDFASIKAVFAGLVLSAVVPLYTFQRYRRRMDSATAAAMRHAVPAANPGVYVAMALAITFPLNIILGIPFYTWLASSI